MAKTSEKPEQTRNRGGRPRTGRMPSITFRGPRRQYQAAAQRAGLTISEWIRQTLDSAT